MNFNDHSKIKGHHALFSASKPSWINKDVNGILEATVNSYKAEIGTALHDICRGFIEEKIKMKKIYKPVIYLMLRIFYHIPSYALNVNEYMGNMIAYVNDAIGFRMSPEVILYYSDNFFGTADAIDFRNNKLRIHDLKTGTSPAHMEQLVIYAALFCLEYKYNPKDIQIELRIYQAEELICLEPDAEDILNIMQKIKMFDKSVTDFKEN